MVSHVSKLDGGIDPAKIMSLNTKQLKKFAEEMKLRVPKVLRKRQLQKQIISSLISNSSDWKMWALTSEKLSDNSSPPKADIKIHWSPPKDGPAFQVNEKYPEKGVRVMDISEAYPDDTSTLSGSKKTGLKKPCSITQPGLYDLNKGIPNGAPDIFPGKAYTKLRHNTIGMSQK